MAGDWPRHILAAVHPSTADAAITLLRTLAGAMEDGLVGIGQDGRILTLNGPAATALGMPADAEGLAIGDVGLDFRALHAVERCLADGGAGHVEMPDSHVVIDVVPAEAPLGALLVIRDETQLRRLERMRSDFVSNVSHELRTPVTAIRLMVETLEGGALHDPEAALGFVRRIAAETAHLTLMVEELLELSAIESGHLSIASEPVAVATLLDSVDRLRPLADAKGVELLISESGSVPAVSGDPIRLGQVLRNLVHNAIKFTPRGGTVTVSASREDGWVRLRCVDTGVGIRPEDLPRIFERFWKADASRQRDGEGTGLGLSIARHIIELHGGQITVDSQPRQGTTFTVELPAADGDSTIPAS